jgi:UDP-GlcNAc:undecaprenyl-phosphate GlcNAc-1-phosphate transferase
MNNFLILLYPFLTLGVILFSIKFNFLDYPLKDKIHFTPTPNVLGLCIYFFLFLIIISNEFSYEVELIIALGLFIIIIGFCDDLYNLAPGTKIFFKSIPVLFLLLNDLILFDIGNYEFIGTIYLNKFNLIFLYFCSLTLINSFNYIDGIDGLTLSVSITALLFYLFLSDPNAEYIILFKYILYCLIISLIFNLLPGTIKFKSFLGNSGSLFLGFFFSFVIIFLYKKHNIHPSILIWSCWLPVYDLLYVSILRIINKKNIFQRDLNHFHYKLYSKFGKNSLITLLTLILINITVIIFGYLIFSYVGKIYSLISFIGLFLIYFFVVKNLKLVE